MKPKSKKPSKTKPLKKTDVMTRRENTDAIIQSGGNTEDVPAHYGELLEDLKARIRTAQVKAAVSVNRELIALYWRIGGTIVQRQRAERWGNAVVERLAADLRTSFPDMGGFTARNIWHMRLFYLAYESEGLILQQPAAELGNAKLKQPVSVLNDVNLQRPDEELSDGILSQPTVKSRDIILKQPVSELNDAILQHPVAEIPWGHNIVLLQKLKDPAARLWYARQTVENGWSRAMLTHWIESDLYARQGKAITNFKATLPAPQSDLAAEIVRDPYNFDFLTLRTDAVERDIERGLLDHIRKFLLELGSGFAFVGQQVPLEVDGEDYYIDLLFYHLRLRCYVVIDLKARSFKPEYAGKMNFYLSAVDDLLRHPDDKPSIGIILCKTRGQVVAEYALRDVTKPVGVARYNTRLVEALPDNFKNELPTIEQIQAELADPGKPPAKPSGKRPHRRGGGRT